MAQVSTTIPAGSNIVAPGVVPTLSPANGDSWILGGAGISLSSIVTLPTGAAGTPGLTIEGSGNTLSLTNAGAFGLLRGTNGIVSLSNITLTGGNQPAGRGGAVSDTAALTINATAPVIFIGNTALVGGAVGASTVTINGSVIANGNTSTFTAAGFGGGAIEGISNVVITGGVFMDGNVTGGSGGAIVANTTGNASLATVSGNVTLTNNRAGFFGGAIDSNSAVNNLLIGNPDALITITGNSAGSNGGALVSNAQAILTGSNIILSNNQSGGVGGGIGTAKGVIFNGPVTANSNRAAAGGAVFVVAGDVTAVADIAMDGNLATAGDGGAIVANGSVRLATASGNASVTNNTATGNGGGIRANDVTIGNPGGTTVLSNNRAGFNGTGVAVNNTSNGGAIASSGTTTLTGTAITLANNQATANGGGVSTTTMTIVGPLTATGNTAGASGGAIFAVGNFTLDTGAGDTSFGANTATTNGGAVSAGGNVSLAATGGNITFTGNMRAGSANALFLNNTGGGHTATFDAAAGRSIAFFDPIASDPANGRMSIAKTGLGLLSFDASLYSALADRQSTVYADTTVQAGTFEVANNAVYGVHAATVGAGLPSVFTTVAGTTLQGGVAGTVIADQFTLGGDLSIAGRRPDTFGVFTIDSNAVTFGPGSQVRFNTLLNDGAVQNTDLLVLNLNGSATSGQAAIVVTNAGGSGALTVGNGIQLVQTNNGTTAGAFTLGNRVAAGAFEYLLFYGGSAAAGGNPNDQNWYLRSTVPPQPPTPTPPTPPPPPPPPPTPELPNFRVEVPVDMAVPVLAQRFGLAMLGTYHDRVGEEYFAGPAPAVREIWCKNPERDFRCRPSAQQNAVYADAATGEGGRRIASWARIFGETGSAGFGGADLTGRFNAFSTHGPSYSFDLGGFQTGLDLWRNLNADGTRDVAGVYLGAGRVEADIKAVFGGKAGSTTMDGYSVGAYWTRKGATGWYADAVIQGTWYDRIRASSVLGETLKSEGFGFTASLEGGYPLLLGYGWTIEPQAQLIYQNVSLDSGADRFGLIDFRDSDAVYGRIGARVTRNWALWNGVPLTVWARANLWSDFGSEAKTTFAGLNGANPITLGADLGGNWAQLGVGVSGQLTQTVTAFATGDYNTALGDKARGHSLGGRAGVKVVW